MQLYNSTVMLTIWKNTFLILFQRSDFNLVVNLSIVAHALIMRLLISLYIDEILLPRNVNCSTDETFGGKYLWNNTRLLPGILNKCWEQHSTKMKRSFFQAAVTSILLYGCTTWSLTKRLEKKLDGNYTRMLRAILNKSWRQHPTRHQLYGHLFPITKTIQVRRTRHAGHCWRSTDELIRDVLLWTPTHSRAKVGRPARTYIQQLCEDTGCCPEDLPRAMNDREEWRERIRDIRATSATWWWWWWWWWSSTHRYTSLWWPAKPLREHGKQSWGFTESEGG